MKVSQAVRRYLMDLADKDPSAEGISNVMHSLYLDLPLDDVSKLSKKDQERVEDHMRRGLYIKDFYGEYGYAGTIYTIEGSPARGKVFCSRDFCFFENVFRQTCVVPRGSYTNAFKTLIANYFFRMYEKREELLRGNKEQPAFKRTLVGKNEDSGN